MPHNAGGAKSLLAANLPISGQTSVENHSSGSPPELLDDHTYTRCYCEENVYLLCQEFMRRKDVSERWEAWAVFISNGTKTVALWEQKATREAGAPVVWDYHVILVLKSKSRNNTEGLRELGPQIDADEEIQGDKGDAREYGEAGDTWVYDFDTSITPAPCQWSEYVRRTFPFGLIPQYRSLFRVIPGEVFVSCFASDRSHMLLLHVEGQLPSYYSPPPVYEPICGEVARNAGVTNNLMQSFVRMNPEAENTYGDVLSLEEAVVKFLW